MEKTRLRRVRGPWLRGEDHAVSSAHGLSPLLVTAQCKRRMSRNVSLSQSGTERETPGKGLPACRKTSFKWGWHGSEPAHPRVSSSSAMGLEGWP